MSGTNIIDASHSINNSGVSSSSSSSSSSSKFGNLWKGAPPPEPPSKKASKAQEASFKNLQTQTQAEIDSIEKKKIIAKIQNYINSPVFKELGYFKDLKISVPTERDSLDHVEQVYDAMKSVIHIQTKRMMVLNMFEGLLTAGCQGAKSMFQLDTDDFASFVLQPEVLQTELQPELEEIAIELGNSLIPNPYVRVGMKLFNLWKNFQDLKKAHGLIEGLNSGKPAPLGDFPGHPS